RGGVQYFSSEKYWGIRKLYSWGSWSLEFNSLTIIRYLLSRNNNLVKSHKDYINPRA
ncbi:uncharacterized protein K441DRAFT_540898, partial [Cenococcum geophilum 1.58]|uniref:uncharacterized protein n=1 Tax=Cenococcum geophilum 1.58 TaxID=794803 RepID=UPI00358F676A